MLYIPLQIFSREYRSKLSIAAKVASEGIPVCLGHKSFVQTLFESSSDPGVILNNGVGDETLRRQYEKHLDMGHKLVAQDEEAGIIFRNFSDFYSERTSLQHLEQISKLFTWGPDDFQFMKKNAKDKRIIINSGSPRASFWGDFGKKVLERDINSIKSKFGAYIFFPTNFATYNNFLDAKAYKKHLDNFSYYRDGGHDDLIKRRQHQYEQEMMDFVINASEKILENFDCQVIIRPHPSEGLARWQSIIKKLDASLKARLHIIRDGDVTPWIFAANLVVQRGCTTGMEATLSRVPVVSYINQNWIEQDPKRGIVDDNSYIVCDTSELLDAVYEVLNKENSFFNPDFYASMSKKVKDPGSSNNIATMANELIKLHDLADFSRNKGIRKIPFANVYDIARTNLPRLNRTASIMDKNKRPRIQMKQIKNDLLNLRRSLHISRPVNFEMVAPSTFLLHCDP